MYVFFLLFLLTACTVSLIVVQSAPHIRQEVEEEEEEVGAVVGEMSTSGALKSCHAVTDSLKWKLIHATHR